MKQYLLSVYHPDVSESSPPPAEIDQIMADVEAVNDELRAAGAWVFAGGLYPSEHGDRAAAHRRRRDGHRRPVSGGQGAHRGNLGHQGCGPRCGAGMGPQGRPRPAASRSRCVRSRRRRKAEREPLGRGDDARVFREEHGRAVAVLVRVFGDIDLAEDAVQEAFVVACERWPSTGLPPSPGGWIITTARNRAIDRLRRESSRDERHRPRRSAAGAAAAATRRAGRP